MTDPTPAARTPLPPDLFRHLARHLAGFSDSGARLSVERRRQGWAKITAGRPDLAARLRALIAQEQGAAGG